MPNTLLALIIADAAVPPGFVETVPWDDRFSPIAWEYDLHGRPDIYVMEYRP